MLRTALLLAGGLATSALLVLGFFGWRAWSDPFPRIPLVIGGDWPYQPDAELGYAAVANGVTHFRRRDTGVAWDVFTDGRGLRVGSRQDAAPERVELLVLGGSFAWGTGMPQDETFAAQLGRAFGVRSANAALGGYGTLQSLGVLRRQLGLRPRVVLYAFIEDHLRRNLSPCAPNYAPFCVPVPSVGFDAAGAPRVEPPRRGGFDLALNRRFHTEVAMREGFGWPDLWWRARVDLLRYDSIASRPHRDDTEARWLAARLVLGEMAELVHEAGAALVVVHIPYLDASRPGAAPATLRDALAPDVVLIDLAEAVRAEQRRSGTASLVLPADVHPSAAAHALFAREIERRIRSDARVIGRLALDRSPTDP